MEFTNRYGIKSQSLIDALEGDDYDLTNAPENVVSVTSLIDAPIHTILKKRHWEELSEDISGRVWTLLGSAVHYVVERFNKHKARERLSEERWYLRVPTKDGEEWEIHTIADGEKLADQPWYNKDHLYLSGKFDNYDMEEKSLEDYKTTSAWSFVFGGKDSWPPQLNIHGFAVRMLGLPVEILRICGILKDHTQSKVSPDSDYPAIPLVEKYYEVWPDEQVKEYIKQRYDLFLRMRQLPDEELTPCTEEERWYKPGKYAVMKGNNKKAVKLFDETPDGKTSAEALANDTPGGRVEPRPGEDIRCTDPREYCTVKRFCPYWKVRYGSGAVTKESW